MDYKTKQILTARLKSLAWRTGTMVAALMIAFVSDNLALFHLHPIVVMGIGLILGEVTKYLNTKE